ncbi:unnamed protein product [Pleuronectes platessa]|uniref:Uncharacterized protein n=1 Tax=Pleuronectes platessa TaxID=8262 RepID=A0A9N7VXQ3_PLEPL|nr:unnamed protein product [Pleuronectes platessa]
MDDTAGTMTRSSGLWLTQTAQQSSSEDRKRNCTIQAPLVGFLKQLGTDSSKMTHLGMQMGMTGYRKLLTFRLEDDRSTPQPQPPKKHGDHFPLSRLAGSRWGLTCEHRGRRRAVTSFILLLCPRLTTSSTQASFLCLISPETNSTAHQSPPSTDT